MKNTNIALLVVVILFICGMMFKRRENFTVGGDNASFDRCNQTQKDYSKLVATLKEMSSENSYQSLKPLVKHDSYTFSTITQLLRRDIHQVIEPVIADLNRRSGDSFHFEIIEYKNASIGVDNMGNKQFVVDVFLTEMMTNISIRVKVDVIKYGNDRDMEIERKGGDWTKWADGISGKSVPDKPTCAKLTNPGFPDSSYMGYPAHEQMIPLPSEVVPTGNFVMSADGINTHTPTRIKKLYLNYIYLTNSDLVLDPYSMDSIARLDKVVGAEKDRDQPISAKRPLEFMGYDRKDKNPNQDPAYIRNKWPRLETEPGNRDGWPSTSIPFEWDDLSISPEVKATKEKPGLIHSDKPYPRTAQFWRGNFPPQCELNSMFDLTSGLNSRNVPI